MRGSENPIDDKEPPIYHDAGNGQAAEERLRKRVDRFRIEDHPPGVSDGEDGGPLREVPKPELIALLHDPFVQLADIRPKPFDGSISDYATSQVHLLITNHAVCAMRRATAQSKGEIDHRRYVAEASPVFQADWPDCMHFSSLSCSCHLLICIPESLFCTYESTVPCRSRDQISFWNVSLVILGTLEPPARNTQLIAISRNLASFDNRIFIVVT
jgi:hypothetical protein